MGPDEHICLCFRVSRRKLVNYCRIEKPKVASQLSQCHGAGTGCGWCVPFLKMIFEQWQKGEADPDLPFSMDDYARRREWYKDKGERTMPEEDRNAK
ncbi:MAG: (2Fe-2S)-binding protein [Planctomycetota bacterium]|nr:(2Fe-2S)-binding protein [Planctomycetota bacterium]